MISRKRGASPGMFSSSSCGPTGQPTGGRLVEADVEGVFLLVEEELDHAAAGGVRADAEEAVAHFGFEGGEQRQVHVSVAVRADFLDHGEVEDLLAQVVLALADGFDFLHPLEQDGLARDLGVLEEALQQVRALGREKGNEEVNVGDELQDPLVRVLVEAGQPT